jgi:hypothetical protein
VFSRQIQFIIFNDELKLRSAVIKRTPMNPIHRCLTLTVFLVSPFLVAAQSGQTSSEACGRTTSFEIEDLDVCTGDLSDTRFKYTGDQYDDNNDYLTGLTLHWDYDGGTYHGGNGTLDVYVIWDTPGVKHVSVVSELNGCFSDTVRHELTVYQFPDTVLRKVKSSCESYAVSLSDTTNTEVIWNFDDWTVLSGSGNGPYELTWTSPGFRQIVFTASNPGCVVTAHDSINVTGPAPIPQICLVTVDDDGKNELVWDYEARVDSFGIYRETEVAGVYALVDYVSSDSNSFVDEESEPLQQANRYMITAVDTCGLETPSSQFHKTIHLAINIGLNGVVNLDWSNYEGFPFGSYNILRSVDEGPFEILDVVASTLNSFTDLDVPGGLATYQIEVVRQEACAADPGGRSKGIASSRSNVARHGAIMALEKNRMTGLTTSPNPIKDKLTISDESNTVKSFTLLSIHGVVIETGNFRGTTTLDFSAMAAGIYILKVSDGRAMEVRKITKR